MEDKFRLKVFLDNKHKIAKHNTRYANGLVSYKVEMNKFGDMVINFRSSDFWIKK